MNSSTRASEGRTEGLEQDADEECLDAFLALAMQRATEALGDGCRIWATTGSDRFELIAVDHRDHTVRDAAAREMGMALRWPSGGWLAHAIDSGCAVRAPLRDRDAREAVGVANDDTAGDALIAAFPSGKHVVVATRDRLNGHYSERDRTELGRIVGAAAMDVAPESHRRADPRHDVNDLLDSGSTAVWLVDERGVTTYVNRAGAELVGLPPSLIVGAPISEFVGIDELELVPRLGPNEHYERSLLRSDGSCLSTAIAARQLLRSDGRSGGVAYTLHDITESRQREAELRTALDVERSLGRFADFLLRDPRPREIAERAVEVIGEQFGSRAVALGAISLDRREARLVACSGSPDTRESTNGWVGRRGPVREEARPALEADEPVIIRDVRRTTLRHTQIASETGAKSMAIVRVAGGRGCIAAFSLEVDGVTSAETEMLSRVAGLLGSCWDEIVPNA